MQPTQPLADLDPADPQYASGVVDRLLAAGRAAGASDLHLQATAEGLEAKLRIDGVLQPLASVPRALAANVIARLKVQAELLTYRTDTPQEGRIRLGDGDVEMRLSTFPTLHGESAVVRLFGRAGQYERLADLGLPGDVLPALQEQLGETAGAILVSGPAGSGKTTTVYACLRELAARAAGARSLVSLEDPIEVAVPGVAQSQVNPAAGLDLATGLRFLMRQDPEVIMVGEIRDRATAEAAMQASLTGHLLLSTFHAGSAVETLGRLLDMGIEPYIVRSGLLAILSQRLLRRLCSCAQAIDDPAGLPGPAGRAGLAAGRLPGLRRDRLSRADPAGGDARFEVDGGRRVRPGRVGQGRHHRVGTVGGAGRHGHALAEGDSGRRVRRNQSRRGPPRLGLAAVDGKS